MAIHVALTHRTTYRYDRPVDLSPHVVRLRPAPHTRTPILAYSLRVSPEDHFVNWQQDPFGNHLARLVFNSPTRELDVTVDLVADLTVVNPFDFFLEEDAEEWPWRYEAGLAHDLAPYLAHEEPGPLLRAWLDEHRDLLPDGRRTIDVLVGLNQAVNADVAYTVRMEPGVQTPEQTLHRAIGSCRDSGWLLVQVLRNLGLAARFVSGYLVQLTADQRALDGPSGPEADFTDLHAWTEVFLPGAGWVGLDPTSGLFAGEGHIPLAATPEPSTAAAITGATTRAEVEFSFVNEVTRVHEDPRVTRPYDEHQWAAIDALGHLVDRRLADGDVRLTMGGEPTFVSIDDMSSPEWTTAADGPTKQRLAWELAERLERRFASGALVHHGQGKWYPGEPLPRWQMGVLWRADGQPLWSRRDLLADPFAPGTADASDAEALLRGIATRLGVDADRHVQPAFEDRLHDLWQEALLPEGEPPAVDVDPEAPDLSDRRTRENLRERLDRHDGAPAGWLLPLWRVDDEDGWTTSDWTFRRGRAVLVPGDSPMGLRLPLPSVAWEAPEPVPDRDPFAERDALGRPRPADPDARAGMPMVAARGPAATDPGAAPAGTPTPAVNAEVGSGPLSAVCVEPRGGRLHVFLPPLTHLEHAVELVGAVEAAAVELDAPVVVEGYPPPADERVRQLVVTPDPGVIEVNVHPARSWDELVEITTGLFEDARATRLGTETFDLDGHHTGTGGGNHITLGGSRPEDSPLLRRPHVLRSLLTMFQHHPSLSYLFSGRFIGPTSQAPRVDEARHDALHHLEIAFAELDAAGDDVSPWLVDRALRHLLTDLTGNTHRAEFCIDKLFSPDSARGRLGLLELRGFEMPPHPEMSLVQSLLVRALVARVWDAPYRANLVRWGTLLHDRFLLPHAVEQDAHAVADDLHRHDLPFDPAWLDPFVEFRFPRLGTVVVDGVELELRMGIEPWDVLGEEATAFGTARFVDSSMERLQVRARGMVPGRHLLTVNGRPVRLHPTDEPGTAVAGVRYRAWHPPSGLHPTIPVDTPLVFDLVDRHAARSLGGCTYHVSHPGGLSYDTFPVNANEADARRVSRFWDHGHTPGPVDVDALDRHHRTGEPDAPLTMDLRTTRPRPIT